LRVQRQVSRNIVYKLCSSRECEKRREQRPKRRRVLMAAHSSARMRSCGGTLQQTKPDHSCRESLGGRWGVGRPGVGVLEGKCGLWWPSAQRNNTELSAARGERLGRDGPPVDGAFGGGLGPEREDISLLELLRHLREHSGIMRQSALGVPCCRLEALVK